ncbi:MAG: ROK family protein [Clostridiales bacterium]|nr:ROK family protein [Clostridiales bacterium]
MKRYGGIEAGGTKMVMAVADDKMNILCRESIATGAPDATLERMIAFFRGHPVDALGVASFGPLDLKKDSPTYGYITKTPKLDWVDYPLLPLLKAALDVPCELDTDVNAAALCEAKMGVAKGLKNCMYVTIGTGIGAGVYCEGNLVHGLMHPEWGHIPVAPRKDDTMPEGICPYHGGCLEGLASGPAIEKRWGKSAKELAPDHPAWQLEAHYLAQMCVTALMTVSPEKIILGGGVMGQRQLFPMIHKETMRLLGGYLACVKDTASLIVPPACYPDSGLVGALLLAKSALEEMG